ncbi:LD-carboxypeptidase [Vibrio sp. Vb2133]|uniref:Microcin immunity protein MccF n=1 Tax=Vibrio harveyi TaxID=669 RepID=A0A454CY69_VIBHA|nr:MULTISPECIES: S66 peptidase family protein [Vibrio]EKM31355.1 microcin immunity protein MccF [Vibrio harveyi]ELP3328243.1 LD-carboxypeptidase [Vibrio alginolyticus]KZC45211.1 putative carboxypeptidase [Vibrio alginolyticus]MBS9913362.1 LD-carboxypeptidase [Vibrio alginolyticus]MDW1746803.1 LD-carboxypeptidase [Vibrio sp. Vb2133]
MIIPKPLQKGDTIGFFSPSSPATVFAPARFERAKAYVESHGYQLKAGSLTGKTDQYRSGSIQERVEELNALIRDPEVRCIMSTIGGYNSNSLLPYIDYEALKKDPKIIVGYSDVTALLMGIYAQTGIVTFYGPALVASLGEFPPLVDETFASFESIVNTLDGLAHQYTMPQGWTDEWIEWGEQDRAKHTLANQWHFKGEGKITGRLIGGNLNTMTGIWASKFMPSIEQGDILLVEDCLQGIETVERSFALLKLSGVFDKVGAVVLGKHEKFNDKGTGRAPIDVLLEVLNGQPLPILYDFDSCHTHPMLTVPLGSTMTLDFDNETVAVSLKS